MHGFLRTWGRSTSLTLLYGASSYVGCTHGPATTPRTEVPVARVPGTHGAATASGPMPAGCDPDAGALPETVVTRCSTSLEEYCIAAPDPASYVSHVCETLPDAIAKARAAPWEATIATCAGGYVVETHDGIGTQSLFFDRCRTLIGAREQLPNPIFCGGSSPDILAGRSNVGACHVTERVPAKHP